MKCMCLKKVFALPQRNYRVVYQQLFTGASGQSIGAIFEGPAAQACLVCLALEYETVRLFRNVSSVTSQESEGIMKYMHSYSIAWAGQRSRYSDWLRAGRSGDQILVGRDFPHLTRPTLGPTQPPVQSVPGLSGGKERPWHDADPSPPSSAVGHERVELYLYYPLWAVRLVQSLSACTRVTFTFNLYIYMYIYT